MRTGFDIESIMLAQQGIILVDEKKEFGYVKAKDGSVQLIMIDELVTPDSSRFWNKELYDRGIIREDSKQHLRDFLIKTHGKDVLTSKDKAADKARLADEYRVPVQVFEDTAQVYRDIVEGVINRKVPTPENPREEILDALRIHGLVE